MKKSQVMALIITLALLGVSCTPKGSAAQGAEASNQKATNVKLDTLLKVLDDNAAKADQLYGNKNIRTTGKVLDISNEGVHIGDDLTNSLLVSPIPSEMSKLANLQKGQSLTVSGVFTVILGLGFIEDAVIESKTAMASTNNSGSKSATVKEAPVSDFDYVWTDDRQGIRIRKYTGSETVLVIPATIEGLPVREIGGTLPFNDPLLGHISGIEAVTEIVLPKSVIRIGVFSDAKNLSKINFPDGLKEISRFSGTSLTTVNLPNSVEKIGREAFKNCISLTIVKLSDGIEKIDRETFSGCKNLTTVNLPASIKEIEREAFTVCGELNNLIIPDSLSSVNFIKPNISPRDDPFRGCGKLPLATRARLEALGYKGSF